MKTKKYNKGGKAALYDMVKKYAEGGKVEPNREPKIDIKRKKVVQGAEGVEGRIDPLSGKMIKSPVNERSEVETQFFIDGVPATTKDAMRAFKQTAAFGSGTDFNDFVKGYLTKKDTPQSADKTRQKKALQSRQKAAGSKGLLQALRDMPSRG
jgi:hypothetical protein